MNLGRLPRPAPLPWARPRRELLLLALVAATALPIFVPVGAQDISRYCLTDALIHSQISADLCLNYAIDKAEYGGHAYTDKAPGYSVLAAPAADVVDLPYWEYWVNNDEYRLWAVRLWVVGISFVACAFMVGRVTEGLAPGWGGAALVSFALGTIASSVAVAGFSHLTAAAFCFGAFLLAWGRRPLPAGLAVGAAVLVEYEAGLVVLALGAYVLLSGLRPLGRYALGIVPAAILLGAYNWAAFGSPFRLSYRYVTERFAEQQSGGFFGIHLPTWHGIHLVFVGDRGLLLNSPVLVMAAIGLVLLWRRGWRAEAALCGGVSLAFVLVNCGYFLPYGGDSPGPRFLIPCLPFLAVGLGLAFAWKPLLTSVLAGLSVVASTAVAVTWPGSANEFPYRTSVWRELAVLARHGNEAPIARWFQKDALWTYGVGPQTASAIAAAFALLAISVALWVGWSSRRETRAAPAPAPPGARLEHPVASAP